MSSRIPVLFLAALAVLAVLVPGCARDVSDAAGERAEPDAPVATAPAGEAPAEAAAPSPEESSGSPTDFRPVPEPPEPADGGPEVEPLPPPRVHPRPGEDAAAGASAEDPPSLEAAAPVPHGGIPEAEPDDGLVGLPAGTELEIELVDAVSTRDASPGQRVRARFVRGYTADGRKVPLKRFRLVGEVAVVLHPERKDDRPGGLELDFHTIVTDEGGEYPVDAVASATAGTARKRNVGVVAGSAVVGALLGKKQGDTDEALVGAVVGAAAGAGIVRALPGKHLDLDEGTPMLLTLTGELRLPTVEG